MSTATQALPYDWTPEYLERMRSMTGEEKMRVLGMLMRSARSIKAAGLRDAHPDWSEDQVRSAVRRMVTIGAGTA